MSSELQRSRQRLVTAQEEERRRLRRDLHDGLGPSLATIAMRLEATRDLIEEDPEEAAAAVGRLADLARDEIAEVRRLVEGLRPPGARPARPGHRRSGSGRTATPRSSDPAGVAPGRWTVEADADVEPLPAAVEVAAYRIAMEAVTNADPPQRRRHLHRRRCAATDGVLAGARARRRGGAGRDPRRGCRPDLDEGARGGARRLVHRDVRRPAPGRSSRPACRSAGRRTS